jgi:PIN domain nuclease of toxin-antitoxin system
VSDGSAGRLIGWEARLTYRLDTGVWLRAVSRPHTVPARGGCSRCRARPSAWAISIWEVGKKVQIGKLALPKDLAAWFADALAPNIEVIPLSAEVVTEAMRPSAFPTRDPADELVVASARLRNLILLTTDRRLKGYPHARIQYFRPLADR